MNDYRAYVHCNYNSIYHHGIKGQQWGVRNGPPYPLDEEDHTVREIRKTGGNFRDSGTQTDPKKRVDGSVKKSDSTLKKMAQYAWRDRKQLAGDEIKSAIGIAAYTKGSGIAARLIAQTGWNIAFKNRKIPIAAISANVIDRSRPLVLSAIAAGETIDKFKKIRRYYREAKQSEGGKKS